MAYSNAPQFNTYQQKRVPFVGSPDPRNPEAATTAPLKDFQLCNLMVESWIEPRTGDKRLFLRKRPGVVQQLTYPTGPIRAVYSDTTNIYFVGGFKLYKFDGISVTEIGSLTSVDGPCGLERYTYQDVDYLLISDGTTLWWYDITTQSNFTTFPTGYPTPHFPNVIVIDGYILLGKVGTADIYNSQVDDNTQPWDFISAEMYPDKLTGLSRYNNYVVALGNSSLEMFYDAAIEDGSPFQRNDSAVATIGCPSPRTMLQTDRNFFWVGDTQEGNFSVWMMADFKCVEIGTPSIKQILAAEGSFITEANAYSIRALGHHLYVLNLSQGTWVYDIDEKIWYQWGYAGTLDTWLPAAGTLLNGFPWLFSDNAIYRFDQFQVTDFSGGVTYSIVCQWTTDPIDFDTMNRKFLSRLTIVGDLPDDGATVQVQWSDDNYKTFSAARTIVITNPRPALVNCGYFRRRAFRFTYESFSTLRLEAMELNFNIGVS